MSERRAKILPSTTKFEFSRFCETAAPQRTGPPDWEGDPVPHTRRPPPKHTKATRASVPPIFTETLLQHSLCTKNYQFPTPFRICIASSSILSVQCCPGIPGITPQAAHTLQGEAVLPVAHRTLTLYPRLIAYFPLWKQCPHISLSKNPTNHCSQQQKSRDTISSKN